jgi:signal transduction histidine kinase
MARRAISRVTPAAEAKRILLQIDAAPGLPSCDTDASRVEQILVNLLGNAISHAPEGSTVRLEVTAEQPMVIYTLEDEGSGIPDSDAERIFDVYVTKSAGESQGIGLGLPLSRRLARLLGGELRAVPRPGQGGCFILELPASPT